MDLGNGRHGDEDEKERGEEGGRCGWGEGLGFSRLDCAIGTFSNVPSRVNSRTVKDHKQVFKMTGVDIVIMKYRRATENITQPLRFFLNIKNDHVIRPSS